MENLYISHDFLIFQYWRQFWKHFCLWSLLFGPAHVDMLCYLVRKHPCIFHKGRYCDESSLGQILNVLLACLKTYLKSNTNVSITNRGVHGRSRIHMHIKHAWMQIMKERNWNKIHLSGMIYNLTIS